MDVSLEKKEWKPSAYVICENYDDVKLVMEKVKDINLISRHCTYQDIDAMNILINNIRSSYYSYSYFNSYIFINSIPMNYTLDRNEIC